MTSEPSLIEVAVVMGFCTMALVGAFALAHYMDVYGAMWQRLLSTLLVLIGFSVLVSLAMIGIVK